MEFYEYEYDSAVDEFREVVYNDIDDDDDLNLKNLVISVSPSLRSSKGSIRNCKHYIPRLISKTGGLNTFITKLPLSKRLVYFRDLGNTLLNIRWRWILLTVCIVNFVTFIIFGLLWMWLADISGDFDSGSAGDKNIKDHYCVVNTNTFAGYLLLSVETITTIGYGYRYPTENCQHIWIVVTLQSLVSVAIQGALVSAVYVKISKPFTKDPLSLFSKKAIICLRDEQLCLIIRIVDIIGKVSVGTTITMYFINKNQEDDGDFLQIKQIKIEPYGFLIFPLEIVHIIDESSPLWDLSPWQLLKKKFEIVAVVEGISSVTGQFSQNRTSYTNSDILWGYRFKSCVYFDNKKSCFIIHRKQINQIVPFDTPLCSSEDLGLIKQQLLHDNNNIYNESL